MAHSKTESITNGKSYGGVTSWGGRESAINLPPNFYSLSKDEQLACIHQEEEKAMKANAASNIITHPRITTEQQTHHPIQLNLFAESNLAKSAVLRKAKKVQDEGGNILNIYSFGIEGNATTFKVLQALQERVFRISELYGKKGITLSGSNTLLPSATKVTNDKGWFNAPKGTTFPAICITPYKFAKEVLGGKKPSLKAIGNIVDELYKLKAGNYMLQDYNLKRGIVASILDVSTFFEKDKDEILYIELKPMFALIAGQTYISERIDVTQYMRRTVRKPMTFLLYGLLIEQYSRRHYKWIRYKEAVLARIAKSSRYKDHPTEKENAYKDAIGFMEKIKLLKSYSEDETGAVCTFEINENYLKERLQLD